MKCTESTKNQILPLKNIYGKTPSGVIYGRTFQEGSESQPTYPGFGREGRAPSGGSGGFRGRPFDNQGGLGIFWKKISCHKNWQNKYPDPPRGDKKYPGSKCLKKNILPKLIASPKVRKGTMLFERCESVRMKKAWVFLNLVRDKGPSARVSVTDPPCP